MSAQRDRIEFWMERASWSTCVAALVVCLCTLLAQVSRRAQLEGRIERVQAERAQVAEDNATLEGEIRTEDEEAHRLLAEINELFSQRGLLKLEMTDVLLRVHTLNEQRRHFEHLKADIEKRLDLMVEYYDRKQAVVR